MADRKVIAVVGSTGTQGGRLCQAILADPNGGFSVRGITRAPHKAESQALTAKGAQMVEANLDEPDTLTKAFAGAHGVFAITNFWEHFSAEREKVQAKNIADAAKAAGVKHVVWSTLEDTRKLMAPGDKRMPFLQEHYRVPHFDAKAEADAYFRDLPTTYLVTCFYWDNIYVNNVKPTKDAEGHYSWTFPMGQSKLAGIAADDIGNCAYAIFKAGNEYVGKHVGIIGEALTFEEISQKLSKGLGIGPIKYNAVDADAFRGFGFPGAEEFGNMFQVYRDFEKEVLGARSADVARKLSPQLQTFDQWLAKNKSRISI